MMQIKVYCCPNVCKQLKFCFSPPEPDDSNHYVYIKETTRNFEVMDIKYIAFLDSKVYSFKYYSPVEFSVDESTTTAMRGFQNQPLCLGNFNFEASADSTIVSLSCK